MQSVQERFLPLLNVLSTTEAIQMISQRLAIDCTAPLRHRHPGPRHFKYVHPLLCQLRIVN